MTDLWSVYSSTDWVYFPPSIWQKNFGAILMSVSTSIWQKIFGAILIWVCKQRIWRIFCQNIVVKNFLSASVPSWSSNQVLVCYQIWILEQPISNQKKLWILQLEAKIGVWHKIKRCCAQRNGKGKKELGKKEIYLDETGTRLDHNLW